jgi:hypothetical protein
MNPAYNYSGLRLSTTSLKDSTPSRTELLIEAIDQFAAEMDAFSRCVLKKSRFQLQAKWACGICELSWQ